MWLALPGRWLRAWQRRAPAPGAAGSLRSRAKSGAAERCGSAREAGEALTSPASLGLCRAPLGSALTWGVLPAPASRGHPGRGAGRDQQCPGGDRCLLGTTPKPWADVGASRTPLRSPVRCARLRGLSCTLQQLGLGAEEPQGGSCPEPSAPSQFCSLLPGLMICWAINRPVGNHVRAWPGTTLLFLSSQVGETALFHPLPVTVLLCSSWHSRTG